MSNRKASSSGLELSEPIGDFYKQLGASTLEHPAKLPDNLGMISAIRFSHFVKMTKGKRDKSGAKNCAKNSVKDGAKNPSDVLKPRKTKADGIPKERVSSKILDVALRQPEVTSTEYDTASEIFGSQDVDASSTYEFKKFIKIENQTQRESLNAKFMRDTLNREGEFLEYVMSPRSIEISESNAIESSEIEDGISCDQNPMSTETASVTWNVGKLENYMPLKHQACTEYISNMEQKPLQECNKTRYYVENFPKETSSYTYSTDTHSTDLKTESTKASYNLIEHQTCRKCSLKSLEMELDDNLKTNKHVENFETDTNSYRDSIDEIHNTNLKAKNPKASEQEDMPKNCELVKYQACDKSLSNIEDKKSNAGFQMRKYIKNWQNDTYTTSETSEDTLVTSLNTEDNRTSESNSKNAKTTVKSPLLPLIQDLGQQQLIDIIMGLVGKDEKMENELSERLPKPDMDALKQELVYYTERINAALLCYTGRRSENEHSLSSAQVLLREFQRVLYSRCNILESAWEWDTIIEYLLVAWQFLRGIPIDYRPLHNKIRSECYKHFTDVMLKALQKAKYSLGDEDLVYVLENVKFWNQDCAEANMIQLFLVKLLAAK